MPKEIHYFLFSKEEVFDALVRFQATRAEKLPPDTVATVRLQEAPGGVTALLAGKAKSNPNLSFSYEPDDVLGAMVLYCKSRRIPLATRASKRLELLGDQVALLTTMNLTAASPSADRGSIRYLDDDVEARRQIVKQVPDVIATEVKARGAVKRK